MNVCTVPRRDAAPLLRGQFDDSVSDLFPERIASPWRGSRAFPRQYSDSRLRTNNRPCFPNPLRVFLPGWRGRRVGKRMDVKGQSGPPLGSFAVTQAFLSPKSCHPDVARSAAEGSAVAFRQSEAASLPNRPRLGSICDQLWSEVPSKVHFRV